MLCAVAYGQGYLTREAVSTTAGSAEWTFTGRAPAALQSVMISFASEQDNTSTVYFVTSDAGVEISNRVYRASSATMLTGERNFSGAGYSMRSGDRIVVENTATNAARITISYIQE